MWFQQALFYLFAAILIFAALMVVTRRNPVHSVLYLVLAFFNCAGLWMLAEAEFLAIVLVLVYVGAVMVLFLFVVMMLDINVAEMRAGFMRHLPVGLVVSAIMLFELITVVGPRVFGLEHYPVPAPHPADYNNTKELGLTLFRDHLYAFEIAAVVLLVAIIAAITLTMRKRPETKYQKPEMQVAVKARDRVRLVDVPSEEKGW